MIVPAMNTDEIIREIVLDLPSVLRKHSSYSKNVRRAAIKAKTKTIHMFYEYKSPRRNDWVVFLKATPSVCSMVYAVHYLNKQGFNFMAVHLDSAFFHYSGHFIERYNERFLNLQSLSRFEIFKSFIRHNSISISEELNLDNTDKKRVMIKLNDGIAFGTYEETDDYTITNYKTFISNDMVLSFQNDDVNTVNNNYNKYCSENPVAKKFQTM